MGLAKFLFEEKEPKTTVTSQYDFSDDMDIEVNVSDVSQENLITDIYSNNDMADLSKSVFKVEEVINSLPKEMPKDTKKATVLAIISSFGLSPEMIIEDGNKRIQIIEGAYDTIKTDNESIIASNNALIESKKIEIQDMEKDNAERSDVVANTRDKIVEEENRITALINFVGGE